MDASTQGQGVGPGIELDYELVSRAAIPSHIVDPASPSAQKQIAALRQWLQPTDYLSPGNEFMKHLHSYVPGTGSWLNESPAFQEWVAPGRPNCLAIRGVAGSGKSVLTASTIRQLQEADPSVPVLFFFFRQIVEKNHSAKYLVRDFASQLLPYSQSLLLKLDELRKSNRVEGNEHGLIWDALTDSLHHMEKVYLVVDALDEMDDQDFTTIDRLAQLGNHDGSKAKLLFTSRPIPRIEETMRALDVPYIRLEPAMMYPDVAKYVTVSISTLDTLLSPETEDRVKQVICERARGLFLHARLMTDTLTEGLQTGRITEETLPDSLDRLPYNLIDMYEEMLKEHSRRSGVDTEQQARILTCVIHATRPLRLIELGSLVVRMIGSGDLKDGKALVRASCGRLLEILDDETVSIIHHSFTEFLHDKTRVTHGNSFPVLDDATAHVMFTTLCLQYLDQCPLLETRPDDSDDDPTRRGDDLNWGFKESNKRNQMLQDLSLDYPLLHYARLNLSHHISKAGSGHPDVMSALDAYFMPGKPAFAIWVYGNWRSYRSSALNVIHVASIENWPAYVEHVATQHPELVDTDDGRDRTALSYAAEKGHSQIARYLLEQYAMPNSGSETGFTPLHYAASEGHVDVAKLLIDFGMDPLVQKGYIEGGETALQCAFKSGHDAILDIFLPLVPASQADRCLHWATKAEHLELVLKTGNANVDSWGNRKTKLFTAAENHDLEAIEVLLRHGADPNMTCDMEIMDSDSEAIHVTQSHHCLGAPTPIHAFAGYFDMKSVVTDEEIERARQCLKTLVSYGAQVDARADPGYDVWRVGSENERNLTALHYVVRSDRCYGGFGSWFYQQTQEELARLLLEAGADPNARSKFGRNCIHFANPEQPGLIDVLVAGGADVNATDVEGQSPLFSLLTPNRLHHSKPNIEVFMKLIQNGADLSLSSKDGNTVLHMVFMSLSKFKIDDIPFLLSLVGSSDDFSRENNAGLVPLFLYKVPKYEFPRSKDGEKILEAMVQRGMDINTCDGEGETILWKIMASNNASLDIIQQFVRLGANPALRKPDGSTLLHHAVRKQVDISWLSYLVTSGVDPKLQDNEGRTPIHLAVRVFGDQAYKGMQFIHALVEVGVPPTTSTISGQTVLHIASSMSMVRDRQNWIDLILGEPMFEFSNPNVANLYGVTPLHHAAKASEFTTGKLLQVGADPAYLTTMGISPLHIACIARKPNTVGRLLSYYKEHGILGQFVNQTPSIETGASPLHYACRSKCLESVRYLLSHGANPCGRDTNDRTPLHVLAEGQQEFPFLTAFDDGWMPSEQRRQPPLLEDSTADIFSLLIKAGADREARATNKDGSSVTVMDLALAHNSPILVKELSSSIPNDDDRVEGQAQAKEEDELYKLVTKTCRNETPSLHVIKTLIEANGLDVNRLLAPLHILASGDHFWQIEALQYLLSRGVDTELLNSSDKSPLFHTIWSHPPKGFWKEATIRILLEHGSDPNQKDVRRGGSGHSCLELSNDAEVTRLLLDYGADVSQSPGALHHAIAERMDPDIVRHLLEKGADPNLVFKDGMYPLHCAARHILDEQWVARQPAVVKTLLEHGADPLRRYDDGRHILQVCIEEHGNTGPLLEVEGLDLECRGKDGRTALISACITSPKPRQQRWPVRNLRNHCHPETGLALLARGAVADALDDTGRSALHWLCTFEEEPFAAAHKDLLAAFVAAKGSLVHVADKAGYKPLHLALRSGQNAAVQYLIENGADPSELDPDGNTALHHYARRILSKKVVAAEAVRVFKQFLEMGLDINARNQRGETPLHIFMATGWDSEYRWSDEVQWKGQITSRSERDPKDLVGHDDDEIWDLFKSFGANWKTRDDEGAGLLHVVAGRKIESDGSSWERIQRKESERTFQKLMEEMGLDPRIEDAQLRTPIDLAVARGYKGIVALFGDKNQNAGETSRKRIRSNIIFLNLHITNTSSIVKHPLTKNNMKPTTPFVATLLAFAPLGSAGPAAYGICQAGCAAVVTACYGAAGFTWGATMGATAPATVVACNAAFATCQASCWAAAIAPTP
ncbi:ankyrin [Nemania sp. FL0031]|nr:ankyrin [Nemania sp. FL0031]